jgi:arylformamidase
MMLDAARPDKNRGYTMQKWILGAAAIATLATCAIAQRGERLPQECRSEVVQKCGRAGGREAIIGCIRQKAQAGEFSEGCTMALVKMAERKNAKTAKPVGGTELNYGSDAKQALDYYPAKGGAKKPPLVVFIHGGGWAIGDKKSGTGDKAKHFTANGYAFASLDYRLVPDADPAGQAADIASALAYLRGRAGELGFDPDRIVLSGHSAGAHLAALVSSDDGYLKTAGVPLTAIRGTVLLDGAGYDVATQMNTGAGPLLKKMYTDAFSTDPAKQKQLSPLTYAAGPNVRQWLLFHDAKRQDATSQANGFAAALKTAGESTRIIPVPDSSHLKINHDVGAGDNLITREFDAFIKAVL